MKGCGAHSLTQSSPADELKAGGIGAQQFLRAQRSDAVPAALDDVIAADPDGSLHRVTLAEHLMEIEPLRAYRVALAGLRHAERGGHDFAAATFAHIMINALLRGARGGSFPLGELRSLAARARAGYDRPHAAVPRAALDNGTTSLKMFEWIIAQSAGQSDDTRVPAIIVPLGIPG